MRDLAAVEGGASGRPSLKRQPDLCEVGGSRTVGGWLCGFNGLAQLLKIA